MYGKNQKQHDLDTAFFFFFFLCFWDSGGRDMSADLMGSLMVSLGPSLQSFGVGPQLEVQA